jgi:hypothetical protein
MSGVMDMVIIGNMNREMNKANRDRGINTDKRATTASKDKTNSKSRMSLRYTRLSPALRLKRRPLRTVLLQNVKVGQRTRRHLKRPPRLRDLRRILLLVKESLNWSKNRLKRRPNLKNRHTIRPLKVHQPQADKTQGNKVNKSHMPTNSRITGHLHKITLVPKKANKALRMASPAT